MRVTQLASFFALAALLGRGHVLDPDPDRGLDHSHGRGRGRGHARGLVHRIGHGHELELGLGLGLDLDLDGPLAFARTRGTFLPPLCHSKSTIGRGHGEIYAGGHREFAGKWRC